MCWGAVIGGLGYTASVAFSDGGFSNWNSGDFWKSVGVGAVSGAVTAGVGNMFGSIGGGYSAIGDQIAHEMGRTITHSITQGLVATYTGGDMMAAVASAGLGSLGGSAFSMLGGNFANSMLGQVGFSTVSGGIGAELSGGDFWRGPATGATIGLLNHASAKLQEVNPEKMQERILKDGRLTLREANLWYRHGKGTSLTVNASKIDLDFINPDTWTIGNPRSVQTLSSSRDGKIYGHLTLEYEGNQLFKIHPDEYDFRMWSGNSPKTRARNSYTKVGKSFAGSGTSYWIHFNGLNKVNYIPNPLIIQ